LDGVQFLLCRNPTGPTEARGCARCFFLFALFGSIPSEIMYSGGEVGGIVIAVKVRCSLGLIVIPHTNFKEVLATGTAEGCGSGGGFAVRALVGPLK
jgi:hypothetical protein